MLDGAQLELLAGVQQEPAAKHLLVDSLQALDVDLADVDALTRLDVKRDVEHRVDLILVGDRGVDLGEGIALLLQRRQQPRAGAEHVGRDRGSAGFEAEEPCTEGGSSPSMATPRR